MADGPDIAVAPPTRTALQGKKKIEEIRIPGELTVSLGTKKTGAFIKSHQWRPKQEYQDKVEVEINGSGKLTMDTNGSRPIQMRMTHLQLPQFWDWACTFYTFVLFLLIIEYIDQ